MYQDDIINNNEASTQVKTHALDIFCVSLTSIVYLQSALEVDQCDPMSSASL